MKDVIIKYKKNSPFVSITKLRLIRTSFLIFLISSFLVSCSKSNSIGSGIFEEESSLPLKNIQFIEQNDSQSIRLLKAARVVPTKRQLDWQKKELIAFVHFGLNTFTGKEVGEGNENPSLFNPTAFNARQWARIFKETGFKTVILTAKHHDGFCLWPTKTTDYSVKKSRWRKGQGDVVKELSMACREEGLSFGFYLSPWDRHEKTYGTTRYNEIFRAQLKELLTNYGPIAEVWFDGYCGEAPGTRKQSYDWPSYYQLIRRWQPEAVIAIMGPDVRWVGNENGLARESEWSVLPLELPEPKLAWLCSGSYSLEKVFEPQQMTSPEPGSREKILAAQALFWYPAEVDVSIRPSWFYHKNEDSLVKTPRQLVEIYFQSVGRNSVLLLNVPPDTRGLLNENDIKALRGFHHLLDSIFKKDLAKGARVKASTEDKHHPASFIVDDDPDTYWRADEGQTEATLEFSLKEPKQFDCLELQEEITRGQRIEKFSVDIWNQGNWVKIANGTTIGYKRLLNFPEVTSNRIRLIIQQSRATPTLKKFSLFRKGEF
ncbi:MAG: alpha-L-fucosidase [Candidatus Saccharicenans sp.]|nr:alpha-L-fucosidase [Candidatus Aminicenantes bacterium]